LDSNSSLLLEYGCLVNSLTKVQYLIDIRKITCLTKWSIAYFCCRNGGDYLHCSSRYYSYWSSTTHAWLIPCRLFLGIFN